VAQHRRHRAYTNVRRITDVEGFAQQHDFELVVPSGATTRMSASMFVKVSGGKFQRIDEYLDAAAAAKLFTP
jgi:ketosteroid isomerase-like protein